MESARAARTTVTGALGRRLAIPLTPASTLRLGRAVAARLDTAGRACRNEQGMACELCRPLRYDGLRRGVVVAWDRQSERNRSMRFAPNRMYVEAYHKCGNCGLLLYEKPAAQAELPCWCGTARFIAPNGASRGRRSGRSGCARRRCRPPERRRATWGENDRLRGRRLRCRCAIGLAWISAGRSLTSSPMTKPGGL